MNQHRHFRIGSPRLTSLVELGVSDGDAMLSATDIAFVTHDELTRF